MSAVRTRDARAASRGDGRQPAAMAAGVGRKPRPRLGVALAGTLLVSAIAVAVVTADDRAVEPAALALVACAILAEAITQAQSSSASLRYGSSGLFLVVAAAFYGAAPAVTGSILIWVLASLVGVYVAGVPFRFERRLVSAVAASVPLVAVALAYPALVPDAQLDVRSIGTIGAAAVWHVLADTVVLGALAAIILGRLPWRGWPPEVVAGGLWTVAWAMLLAAADLADTAALFPVALGVALVMEQLLGLLRESQRTAVRMRELAEQAFAAQERERRALAEALHDDAVQNLLAASQDLETAAAGDPASLERARQAVRRTADQLRDTIYDLHPVVLAQVGLASALEALGTHLCERSGCRPSIEVDPGAVGVRDSVLYALSRELLGNAAHHALASRLALRLTREGSSVRLTVEDDGRGFDPGRVEEAVSDGHIGLASVRERVEGLGGSFSIDSQPGHGTSVRIALPVDSPRPLDRY